MHHRYMRERDAVGFLFLMIWQKSFPHNALSVKSLNIICLVMRDTFHNYGP